MFKIGLSLATLVTTAFGATRQFNADGVTECRYAEFEVAFGGSSFFALGIGPCATFYLALGTRTGLLPSSIAATCSGDGSQVILTDYSSADCDPLTINNEYTLDIGDSGVIYGSTIGLPATLIGFNCDIGAPDDCTIISQQQYFVGNCDPFGDKGNTPDFVGTLNQINGYCIVDAFNGLSQRYDCEDETIRFYNNTNCDESDGVFFENRFDDAAQCLAQGPSAQNGGYNESSVYTCAQIADSSDSSDSSDSGGSSDSSSD